MNTNNYKDSRYLSIVNDILDHQEFNKTKDIIHHGMNRYDHSLRVSYYSYKISKLLGLDTKKVARGALLHDFFLEENDGSSKKDKINTMLKHPEYAYANANKYFDLSDVEKDIITTHMFPVVPRVPKYMESWVVDAIDDVVSVFEKLYSVRRELSAAISFILVITINSVR